MTENFSLSALSGCSSFVNMDVDEYFCFQTTYGGCTVIFYGRSIRNAFDYVLGERLQLLDTEIKKLLFCSVETSILFSLVAALLTKESAIR